MEDVMYHVWNMLNHFNRFNQKLEDLLWDKVQVYRSVNQNKKINVFEDNTSIEDKLGDVWYEKINGSYKKFSFKGEIKKFYKDYESREFSSYKKLGKLAKILAGDFVENNKKYYHWNDRFEKFYEFYDKFDDKHEVDEEILKLGKILKLNTYLKRTHPEMYAKLQKKISEIESSKIKIALKKWLRKRKNARKNKKNNRKKSKE